MFFKYINKVCFEHYNEASADAIYTGVYVSEKEVSALLLLILDILPALNCTEVLLVDS